MLEGLGFKVPRLLSFYRRVVLSGPPQVNAMPCRNNVALQVQSFRREASGVRKVGLREERGERLA